MVEITYQCPSLAMKFERSVSSPEDPCRNRASLARNGNKRYRM